MSLLWLLWLLWPLILAIVLLTLVCYAFLQLTANSTNSARSSRSTDQLRKKRVCLVIAHPDDECMFFGPIVRALTRPCSHNQLYVLCLTTGNFYGQGGLRTKELSASVAWLLAGSPTAAADITCADEPGLADGPRHEWNQEVCARVVRAYMQANAIDVVVTFDERGVSGHPNHCAVHHALQSMQLPTCTQVEAVYSLSTVPLLRKYLFLLDLLPSLLLHHHRPNGLLAISSPADFVLTLKAMLCHKSQLMWFRWLYLVSSRYMLINSLERMG